MISEAEEQVVVTIFRKQKANRKTYIDKSTLSHVAHYNKICKKLSRLGLIFFYKGNEVVGLTEDGAALAISIMGRKSGAREI